ACHKRRLDSFPTRRSSDLIYHGETETGVTVIHMTPQLDGGPCLVQRRTPIAAGETAPQLEARLAHLGVDAVLEAITLLAADNTGDRKSTRLNSSQDQRSYA